jgi:hypothetical protein
MSDAKPQPPTPRPKVTEQALGAANSSSVPINPENPRFQSARHGKTWQALDGTGDAGERLSVELRDTLNSHNLVVLAGLGTTLCVKEGDKRLAPTMVDLWNAAKEKAGTDFAHVLNAAKYEGVAKTDSDGNKEENIELLLSRCQMAAQILSDPKISDFISKTEELIVQRVSYLKDDRRLETHEAFLRKIARRPGGRPRLKLFTTNYDMCFEQAAAAARFIPVDGFALVTPHSFDGIYFDYDFVRKIPGKDSTEPVPNVFHLFKLHGSLNWRQPSTSQTIKSLGPGKPVIIYPRDSKFETSYQQPFLEMMARFQAALREPNTGLVITGFGFNDQHLVEPILTALRSNVSLRLLVANPTISTSKSPAMQWLQSLVEQGDHRVTLLESTFENLVTLIPDLVTKTEDELHQERIAPTEAK